MAKEYAVYPFDWMCITQRYDQGNHIPHWKGSKNYSDKPWDEACKDGGRSYFIPQNDFKVEQILGLGTNATTNTVRLISVNKLTMPCGRTDYLKLTLTHMNEDNLRKVKVGQVLKKGSKILLEGTDGMMATGNHFHITANVGKYYGLLKNTNGSWCFTYEKSLLPQEAFYINSKFTKIRGANGVKFKEMPKDAVITKTVIPNALNMRDKASLSGKIIAVLKAGTKVTYVKDAGTSNGYTWCQIKASGKTGYVAKKYLK